MKAAAAALDLSPSPLARATDVQATPPLTTHPACLGLHRKQAKKKRAQSGDPGTEEYLGPWAPPKGETAPAQLVPPPFST